MSLDDFDPQSALSGLTSLKNVGNFAVLVSRPAANQVHADVKNLAPFTQSLVQNGMSLLLALKPTGSGLKIAKTKYCSKNVDVQFRGLRVKSTGEKSAKLPQIRFFDRYLINGFSPKMISIKSVFTSNLSFLTLKTRSLI